jgi:hypothetical protein
MLTGLLITFRGMLFTLKGSYTLTMKLLGDSNEELTCISFGFSIGLLHQTPLSKPDIKFAMDVVT